MTRIVALSFVAIVTILPALAATEGRIQRGRVFARTWCGQCHATDRHGTSPLAGAPAFRDLHKRFPVEDLTEAFGEGIRTGHPTMPEFRLDGPEIDDLIAYLKSLE